MGKYCSDCIYMNTKDAKCDGIYKCKIKKEFVYANNIACDKFTNSYSRNYFEKQSLYDLGKESEQNDDSVTGYIFILLILLIIGIIGKLYGY